VQEPFEPDPVNAGVGTGNSWKIPRCRLNWISATIEILA
jgi:hypothetical protein